MPKRRMTAARRRQIRLWQRAGSRKKKRTPRGKSRVLYHFTTASRAEIITGAKKSKVRRRGFIRDSRVWLTTNPDKSSNVAYRGSTVLQVRVPYKKPAYKEMSFPTGEIHYTVLPKDISGIKVVK